MTVVRADTAVLRDRRREAVAGSAALLLAGGTLLCCALPIVLVSLGLGTAVAAMTSSMPWLIALSHYKAWMFAASAAALLGSGVLIFRAGRVCPSDPELARLCARADRWNRRVLWIGTAVWGFGFFMAYTWLPLRQALAG